MALKYGVFASKKTGTTDDGLPIGDRMNDTAYFARYHAMFLSNGVYGKVSDCGQVKATGSGLDIAIQPIDVLITGWYAYDLDVESFTTAEVTANRIDRYIVQLNLPERLIKIYCKSSTTGVAPELTRTIDLYELSLATITLTKGQTVLSQSNIHDDRLDSNLCGIVTAVIQQPNTSSFLAQMDTWFTEQKAAETADYQHWYDTFTTGKQSEFDVWFANVQNTLSGDVAGNLLDQINKKVDTAALAKVATSGNYLDLKGIPNKYDVGDIYISTKSTSPASKYGGTWQSLGGKFLFAAYSDPNSIYYGGKTGGSATKTILQDNLPNVGLYTHGYYSVDHNLNGATVQVRARDYITNDPADWIGALGGGGKAMDIMPPYLCVYMWERIA